MTQVIDASVAANWILPEAGTHAAMQLIGRAERRIAPTLIMAEVCNVVWKRVGRGEAPPEKLIDTARELPNFFDWLVAEPDLASRAAAIALALDRPVNDCLYLALAEREDARLVTADRRLIERLAATA
jgi:predicted nucleic acid-binding protein